MNSKPASSPDSHSDEDMFSDLEDAFDEAGPSGTTGFDGFRLNDDFPRANSDQGMAQAEAPAQIHRRSEVWALFEELEAGQVKCLFCPTIFKGCSTSNLLRHIRRLHPEVLIGKLKGTKHQAVERGSGLQKARKLKRLFVLAIATSSMPLSIMENRFLKEFMKVGAIMAPLEREVIKKGIVRENTELSAIIKDVLPKAEDISISVNISTAQKMRHSYLNVIAHFMTPTSAKMEKVLLDVISLECNHTARYIEAKTASALKQYSLDLQDIYRIIGNNAEDMNGAFSAYLFPKTRSHKSTVICDKNLKMETEYFSDGDGDSATEPSSESFDDQAVGFNLVFRRYLPCTIHTLMLALEDGYKKAEEAARIKEELFAVIKRYASSHVLSEQLLESTEKPLKFPGDTRWLNILTTFRRFLEVADAVKSINEQALVAEDLVLKIRTIVDILQPFEDVVMKLQQADQPTISKVYPAIIGLQNHLIGFPVMHPEGTELCNGLLAALRDRFRSVLETGTAVGEPIYAAATFLDPRQQKYLNRNVNAAGLVSTMLGGMDYPVPSTSCGSQTCEGEFDYLIPQRCGAGAYDEVSWYCRILSTGNFDKDCNVVEFWNKNRTQMPKLAALASKVLAIPAGSAEVDRSFHVTFNTTERRFRTAPELLRATMMLNFNKDHVVV